jgi:hypothetical protein
MSLKRFSYLGLLIAVLIVSACSPKATPEPTATTEPTATPLPLEGEVCTVGSPCGPDEVPMGFTEDGAPYRGNPNAPVTLEEHSEFQ